jgi:uncharacterized surface protein with fasciclin (FAS1) repeats
MHLSRLLATATAAALIACPAIALAQGAPTSAPTAPAATTPAAPAAPAAPAGPKVAGGASIYDTLKASGQFTILVKAIDQTGLTPYLQKYPNFTFFAPTDQAFNALPPDVLAKLLAPNDTAANQLQQILKYHFLTVPVDSSKIKGAKGPVQTVEGAALQLDGSNPDNLLVNNADIIQADVRTTNGSVVNVIDKVLIPSDSPFAAAAAPASGAASPAAASAPASGAAPSGT